VGDVLVRARGEPQRSFRRERRERAASPDAVTIKLHPEVEPIWPCYRLVLERYVTWADLEDMTLDDVELLEIALDDYQRAQREAEKKQRARRGR
jgi:hypothetical protein